MRSDTRAFARVRPSRRRPRLLVVAGAVVLAGCACLGVALAASGFLLREGTAPALAASRLAGEQMTGMKMDAAPAPPSGYWRRVSGAGFRSSGVTRTYFVGADEVVWDYAPLGRNAITGAPFDDVAKTYVASGPGRIGSRYVKCLYRGYTDAGFQHLQRRAPEDEYLGFLGPVIRAEVGDTIRVVFRNACPFPASIHPHGVLYEKSGEGAPYDDGTSGGDKRDDAVPPRGVYTYVWKVRERAGPGPGDGSSVMWMYHSHTDEVADTYAGLMGPIEITRRGMARPLLPASMVVADMVPDDAGVWLFHCHVNDHIRAGMLTRYKVDA